MSTEPIESNAPNPNPNPEEVEANVTPLRPAEKRTVTLALVKTRAQEYAKQELVEHYEPDLDAYFFIKPLTGLDMDRVAILVDGKSETYGKWMCILAVRKPKVDLAFMHELDKLSPTVLGRLVQAVRKASGMEDDALDKAKPVLSLMDTENTDGTDSLQS